jgi:hypothetical protein
MLIKNLVKNYLLWHFLLLNEKSWQFWARVNQQLIFPLSATDYLLPAVRPSVTLACYQQAGRVWKAESRYRLVEIWAIHLPWPDSSAQIQLQVSLYLIHSKWIKNTKESLQLWAYQLAH